MRKYCLFALLFLFAFPVVAAEKEEHGIAMQGKPLYGEDFTHFNYVNPDAPKRGELRLAAFGSFDTFNPYNIKGIAAAGINYMFDTLLESSREEAFSEYGLIAKKLIVPEDRSSVEFIIDERARFHDGSEVTADDVIFSFAIIKKDGSPIYNSYYKDVEKVIQKGKYRVKFVFKKGADNRELPLIIGQLPVLSKKFYENKDFKATTLEIPVGSGPYMIEKFEPGRFIVYKRNPDYWAKDLPVNKGRYNFDKIRYDYYRDTTVALEALKSGEYDLRVENEAKKWETAYNDDADSGFWSSLFAKNKKQKVKLIKGEFHHKNPSGMQAFVYNLRRDVFKDKELRKALAYVFDYEWTNKNLFYGGYTRTRSYFDNSELAAKGLPSKDELKLLDPYRKVLPPDVFESEYDPPKTDGSGNIRANIEKADAILKAAGYVIGEDGFLYDKNGKKVEFEILLDTVSSATWERVVLPFVRNLKRIGVRATIRSVDINQYKNRLDNFDFDMIVNVWGQSISPGNEQNYFWGSAAADEPGSTNYIGIKNPVVDALIANVVKANTRNDLIMAVRALDRVLQWEYYVIPQWHLPLTRIVYRDKFGIPPTPDRGVDLMSWWSKE